MGSYSPFIVFLRLILPLAFVYLIALLGVRVLAAWKLYRRKSDMSGEFPEALQDNPLSTSRPNRT